MRIRKIEEINVSLELKVPMTDIGFKIEGKWKPDESEQNAAWELYVELVTRISVVQLRDNEGLLREALTSLYSLFEITRKVLKQYGPTVARPKSDGKLSFGYIAIAVLNIQIRPFLAKWHPLLLDWEAKRPENRSAKEHEDTWELSGELRQELNELRKNLTAYANLLADACDVPSLIM
jgi:hypothetical protein